MLWFNPRSAHLTAVLLCLLRAHIRASLHVSLGAAQDGFAQRISQDAHDNVSALALHTKVDDARNRAQLLPAQRSQCIASLVSSKILSHQQACTMMRMREGRRQRSEHALKELLVKPPQRCHTAQQDTADDLSSACLDQDRRLLKESH